MPDEPIVLTPVEREVYRSLADTLSAFLDQAEQADGADDVHAAGHRRRTRSSTKSGLKPQDLADIPGLIRADQLPVSGSLSLPWGRHRLEVDQETGEVLGPTEGRESDARPLSRRGVRRTP
jgi:hypothetical protein